MLMTQIDVKTFNYLLRMGLVQRITWPILQEHFFKKNIQALHHTVSNKKFKPVRTANYLLTFPSY